jgi:hypothetical protein
VVPNLQEVEEEGNTSDVDVDQQLLCESAGGDSLPNVPLPDTLPAGVPVSEVQPDASVGKN